jgi:hypothetical protein
MVESFMLQLHPILRRGVIYFPQPHKPAGKENEHHGNEN